MNQVAFDTLKFTETLKQAGVSDKHAKAEAVAIQGAFSEALNTQLATKGDIQKLKDDMQAFKDEVKKDAQGLKDDMQAFKDEVKADTQGLKDDMQAFKEEVKDEMQDIKAEQRLFKWMIGFNLIMTTGILWKLFIPAA